MFELGSSLVEEALISVALGILGAITYILVKAEKKDDFTLREILRTLALGAIAGLVYFMLRSEYGFPDRVMTFVAGYFARDFIPALLTKAKMVLDVLLGPKTGGK